MAATMLAAAFVTTAAAQDSAPATTPATGGKAINLSLNSLDGNGDACRMTFVVRNEMAAEIEDLGVEIAIFRQGGALDRLMRISFGHMLEGKTRVFQFDVAGTPCDAVDRVLVNDVTRCTGGDLTELACIRAMDVSSATSVGFSL